MTPLPVHLKLVAALAWEQAAREVPMASVVDGAVDGCEVTTTLPVLYSGEPAPPILIPTYQQVCHRHGHASMTQSAAIAQAARHLFISPEYRLVSRTYEDAWPAARKALRSVMLQIPYQAD